MKQDPAIPASTVADAVDDVACCDTDEQVHENTRSEKSDQGAEKSTGDQKQGSGVANTELVLQDIPQEPHT